MIMDATKITKKVTSYVGIAVLVGLLLFTMIQLVLRISKEDQSIETKIADLETEVQYTQQASTLMDYYYKENVCMRFHVVKTMLKAIDKYRPHYFPEGPFTREDFVALALTETTNLDQYTIGGFGERGLFQIMPDMCRAMGVKKNHFDIYVNTELSMFVLREKFNKHKDYYKALIAYNGVIVDPKTKRWRDKYWKRFLRYRRDVDIIFGGK